jgi:hypothetical protein
VTITRSSKYPDEIDVVTEFPRDMTFEQAARLALNEGRAIQGYGSFTGWNDEARKIDPRAQAWYTERNGDGIVMLCPRDTKIEELPSWAMCYMAFEWIDPDKDFGSGVMPRRNARA